MITLQTRPIQVLCRADFWQASSSSSPFSSSSLEGLLHSCVVSSESCQTGCCRRKPLPLAECSLSTSSPLQGSSRKGLVSTGPSRIAADFVAALPIERLTDAEPVCKNHADMATSPDAIEVFAASNGSMCFTVEDVAASNGASRLVSKESDEDEDGALDERLLAEPAHVLPHGSSLPFSEQDASSNSLENELHILKQEKLRRKRISEANKNRVPWNKGMKYKQGKPRKRVTTNKNSTVLDDSLEMIAREKQRRQRIATANLGKVPWNKGRPHSEETRRRIRERTAEAMKNPKVRERLRVHASMQSKETKSKISAGLVLMWVARKKLKQEQIRCEEEWKEYVADAARMGHGDDDEYDWNSYDDILRALRKEARSIRRRRRIKGPRQPLTSAHRIKIANAIKAKWADLSYRGSVEAAIHARWAKRGTELVKGEQRHRIKKSILKKENFHDTVVVRSKNLESDESDDNLVPNAESDDEPVLNAEIMPGIGSEFLQSMQKVLPAYRNPRNNQMLENLKRIRAQRRSKETSRSSALKRARILLAEAQMAARTLEAQAATDERALPLLQEAQQLLAEAAESFKAAGLAEDILLETSKGKCTSHSG